MRSDDQSTPDRGGPEAAEGGGPGRSGAGPAGRQSAAGPRFQADPQPWADPQYGADPQLGADPQYGADPHYGPDPQYGSDPQFGADPHDPVGSGFPADPQSADAQFPEGPQPPAGPADSLTPAASPEEADGKAASARRRARHRRRSFWRELPVLVVVALVIALLIKTFIVQAFFIPSSSMEDTLLIGDKVLVNKLVYHLRHIDRGDIIVFDGAGSWDPVPPPARQSPDPIVRAYDATLGRLFHSIAGLFGTVPGQTDYIKRVIGIPGDHVACCNSQGLVTVNGVALHEQSYLFPGAVPSQLHFSYTVPAGRLWVMGDNRAISDDSRLHQDDPGRGTVPESSVIGRAFMIVWPPSRWRVLSIPSTFGQQGINIRKTASGAPVAPGAAAGSAARAVQTALARGVPVTPVAPYLPLAGGFVLAIPLTWLQRQVRLRAGRRHRPG